MDDDVVLSYHNSLLRKSDLELLRNPQWLNDQLIGFWFEYLENEIAHSNKSVCLLSPEVAQFVKLGSSVESSIFLDPLHLSSKAFIILPVNDSVSLDQPGGSHWSLLVHDHTARKFYHLDSLNGGNIHHAKRMANNMGLQSQDVLELKSTQQLNFWDCGIFVCCNAENVINYCLGRNNELASLPLISQEIVNQQRHRMLDTISRLQNSFK